MSSGLRSLSFPTYFGLSSHALILLFVTAPPPAYRWHRPLPRLPCRRPLVRNVEFKVTCNFPFARSIQPLTTDQPAWLGTTETLSLLPLSLFPFLLPRRAPPCAWPWQLWGSRCSSRLDPRRRRWPPPGSDGGGGVPMELIRPDPNGLGLWRRGLDELISADPGGHGARPRAPANFEGRTDDLMARRRTRGSTRAGLRRAGELAYMSVTVDFFLFFNFLSKYSSKNFMLWFFKNIIHLKCFCTTFLSNLFNFFSKFHFYFPFFNFLFCFLFIFCVKLFLSLFW
jgi:hypothetical protein